MDFCIIPTIARNTKRTSSAICHIFRFAEDFWGFAKAGAQLAALHVNYESQPEYDKLKFVQTPDVALNWRVEKMKLSKDKTSLTYNDFLTLSGIPPKAFDYQFGTRSALEWIIDQYRVKTDKRSGIINDPNRADDPQYIVQLIGKGDYGESGNSSNC